MRFPRLTAAASFNSRFALFINVNKISFERQARVQIKLSYCHVIAQHHFESVRWVTWLFTLLSPFSFSRTRTYSPLQYDRSLLISFNYEEIQNVNKHKKENHSFWVSVIYGLEKLYRFRAICKEKTQVFMGKVFLNQEKMPFFLSIKTERKIFVRLGITFKGLIT